MPNTIADQIVALATRLGHTLQAQRLMMATAESCTAGGIAYALTLVPGSSGWFDRGYITYSNEAKQQALGVASVYLRDYGAVSEPVARAMALGALTHGNVQVAVAATGIAGPGGGSKDKPVGTVCFGWAVKREATAAPWVRTATRQFDGDRSAIRTLAIIAALEGMLDILSTRMDISVAQTG
jgi:nicotinamide-nucleotide amidase